MTASSGSSSTMIMSSATRSVPTAMTSAGAATATESTTSIYSGNYQTTGIPPSSSVSSHRVARGSRAVDVVRVGLADERTYVFFLVVASYIANRWKRSRFQQRQHARSRWSWYHRLGLPRRCLEGARPESINGTVVLDGPDWTFRLRVFFPPCLFSCLPLVYINYSTCYYQSYLYQRYGKKRHTL